MHAGACVHRPLMVCIALQQVVSMTSQLEEVRQRAEAAEAQRAEADAALESTRQQLAETQATSERRLQVR